MAIGVPTFQTAGKKLVKIKTVQEIKWEKTEQKRMQIRRGKIVDRVRKTLDLEAASW